MNIFPFFLEMTTRIFYTEMKSLDDFEIEPSKDHSCEVWWKFTVIAFEAITDTIHLQKTDWRWWTPDIQQLQQLILSL